MRLTLTFCSETVPGGRAIIEISRVNGVVSLYSGIYEYSIHCRCVHRQQPRRHYAAAIMNSGG